MASVGRYKGVDYKRQRICEATVLPSRKFRIFAYLDDKPTGDHFSSIREFEKWAEKRLT